MDATGKDIAIQAAVISHWLINELTPREKDTCSVLIAAPEDLVTKLANATGKPLRSWDEYGLIQEENAVDRATGKPAISMSVGKPKIQGDIALIGVTMASGPRAASMYSVSLERKGSKWVVSRIDSTGGV